MEKLNQWSVIIAGASVASVGLAWHLRKQQVPCLGMGGKRLTFLDENVDMLWRFSLKLLTSFDFNLKKTDLERSIEWENLQGQEVRSIQATHGLLVAPGLLQAVFDGASDGTEEHVLAVAWKNDGDCRSVKALGGEKPWVEKSLGWRKAKVYFFFFEDESLSSMFLSNAPWDLGYRGFDIETR